MTYNRGLLDLAADVDEMERTIGFIHDQVRSLGQLAKQSIELQTHGDNAVIDANSAHGGSMRDNLEQARASGDDWLKAVNEVIIRATAAQRR